MIQSVSFTSAAFEAFAEAYLFFSICLGKKICCLRIKYVLVQDKTAMFGIIKKLFLSFTQFQTWFHSADHLLYYPQLSVFSFHTIFVLLYHSLRNGTQKQC